MVKHIGIVACSAEGAALCYKTICIEGENFMGRYGHPEVTMHTHSLSEYIRYIETGDWESVANLMLSSVNKLTKIGVDFAICPDNTIHQAFDLVIKKSPIPWIHIADSVIDEAKNKNYKCLGVLGTRFLMEGSVYSTKFATAGIDYKIPKMKDKNKINNIIFNELVYGNFVADSRNYFKKVIDRLKNEGCDAVVLGCTEIPLLIDKKDSSLPTLDSTRLLARAALRRAISTTPY
ncbi:unnamed protein product [marine sediment metagenome]|uniref:Aspartate racemase n=1 Tax=marine sediment metagenome TaxID=412755 RepID=X1AVV8_9ZZZZ